MASHVETIVACVVVAVLMASAFLWARIVARLYAREPILPDQQPPSAPWGLIDMMVAMLIKIGMDVVMMAAVSYWFEVQFDLNDQGITGDQLAILLLATSISNLLTTAMIVGLLRLRHASWEDLGITPTGIGRDIRFGIVAFIVLAVPMYAIQALLTQFLPPDHPIITLLVDNGDAGVFYLACFAAVFSAPLAEEMLFRVVLQGWLENVTRALRSSHRDAALALVLRGQRGHPVRVQRPLEDGDTQAAADDLSQIRRNLWPVIITSLLFALAHYSQGPAPVPLFLLALGLGYIYQRTGRILPCMIVHALVNGSSLAALALSRGG